MTTSETYQPQRALPTQIAHPWRATVRTWVAVALSIILVAATIWALAKGLNIETSLEAATTAILLVAGAITRVMASPMVDAALDQFGLGAAPKE